MKRALAALIAGATLSACGGSGTEPEATPGPTETETVTVSPTAETASVADVCEAWEQSTGASGQDAADEFTAAVRELGDVPEVRVFTSYAGLLYAELITTGGDLLSVRALLRDVAEIIDLEVC